MRLRRSDLSKPGIVRRRRGRGFSYTLDGKSIGRADRERIAALVIPPAWTDVWICSDERGHIQAVGTDAAGRRQYRYHDEWRQRRDREKFDHVAETAAVLPKLRRAVEADLSGRGLTRRRVLAAAARILDRAAIRIGGEAYAVDDPDVGEATFGLATIRRDHVRVRKSTVALCFPAKGGLEAELQIDDPALAAVVRALLRRPDGNEELLGFYEKRAWHDVRSSDINDYLREISGIAMTAKDFRTWHGTVAATVSLMRADGRTSATARKRAVAQAMRDAAGILGNTPAVARSAYVHPRVVDVFVNGDLPSLNGAAPADAEAAEVYADPKAWRVAEKTTIEVLNG